VAELEDLVCPECWVERAADLCCDLLAETVEISTLLLIPWDIDRRGIFYY
jgi:hypothetical protein